MTSSGDDLALRAAQERMQRMRRLFDAALDLPEEERAGWLAKACGSDQAMRDEVEALIATHQGAGEAMLDRVVARLPRLAELIEEPQPGHIGPYQVRAQAGRGGMGVVYRAHDPRLRRDVAVKCLPRALTAHHHARDRFIGEARAASALDHSGICTIHDIGAAGDGRLYIAMAWYGGGTLADRLREGPLSPTDAVRIACEVAEALDCAHRAGIVHRDVKPANIAFTESGDVKVLDFGIAALEADGNADVSGTPRYMAPEQLRGGVVDRRADVWSLGVMLYEMLTGNAPFSGSERSRVREALQRTSAERIDLDALPRRLRAVVGRALSHDPDRRHASAAEFAHALRRAYPVGARAAMWRRRLYAAGAAMLIGVSFVLFARTSFRADVDAIDSSAVAVLPFRVSGDASLAWLEDGMADLLAATLTGEGGLRAADRRTVHGALQRARLRTTDVTEDSARALAARMGAGNVLLGEVVGTADRVLIHARLVDVSGRQLARARAQGAVADLAELVDALTAQLLSLRAREAPHRLAALTSTSLPALRAYLEGQSLYRRGRHEEALLQYVRAMDLDTTFALAALAAELTGGWLSTDETLRTRSRDIAWRHRARLAPADRAALLAIVGPNYPGSSGARASITAIDDGLRQAPDRVELWYLLGDTWLHQGRVLGAADWEERARAAFEQALALDSTFGPAMHHLALLHARRRDVPRVDTTTGVLLSLEPQGPTAHFAHWLRGAARGERSSALMPLDSLALEVLGWISIVALDDGVDVELGEAAIKERMRRVATANDRFFTYLALHAYALNRGRRAEALAWTDRMVEGQPDPHFHLRLRVLDALYADGDRDAAVEAASTLATASNAQTRAGPDVQRRMNRCVLAQWHSTEGNSTVTPERFVAREQESMALAVCEAAAAALREATTSGRAGMAVERLDSLLASGPFDMPVADFTVDYANVALARAYEAAGEPDRALHAIRRRVYFLGWQPGLAASLREEARLAALAHDTAGALRAIDHYLALRNAPDDDLRAEAGTMQRERDRLSPGR